MDSSLRLPKCSESLTELQEVLRDLGRQWARASHRPRVPTDVLLHWDELVQSWADSDLPLVIRKSSLIRGTTIPHVSGRELIVADNSPAHWAFSKAYGGKVPNLIEIRKLIDEDAIPFTYATKASEKIHMRYKRTLAARDNVNKCGWKLCHIEPVGLSSREPLANFSLEKLLTHFKALMSPSNHFLVPLRWAGLGEVPEVIEEIRLADRKYDLI
ncbi:MAG: hypothetical protein ACKVQW_01380 [Pyrinomonadaceae bacterium]